jgi:hypothetical protein
MTARQRNVNRMLITILFAAGALAAGGLAAGDLNVLSIAAASVFIGGLLAARLW